MEADWEIELGNDAPIIDAHWAGWIDLTASPDRAEQLEEAAQLPALASALILLNAPSSPVWTAKCDLWMQNEIDPDELNADPKNALQALACYIDLLPRDSHTWITPDLATDWCRSVCSQLQRISLQNCRADLVLRAALLHGEDSALGITAYLTACGRTERDARGALESALQALAEVLASPPPPAETVSRLQ